MSRQLASCLLVVRPSSFGFNSDTSDSNSFQSRSDLSDGETSKIAIREFDRSVAMLKDAGIEVIIIEENDRSGLPDSIFPNNWFSTSGGKVILYPMLSPKRRLERDQGIIDVIIMKSKADSVLDFTFYEDHGKYLEGTGSMVMDHDNRLIYACISHRTHPEVLEKTGRSLAYNVVKFEASDAGGNNIYHTNVMMSVGSKDIVVCLQSINTNKDEVMKVLNQSGKNIIDISEDQMVNFCANILNVRSKDSNYWVLSERAYDNFKPEQLDVLSRNAELLKLPLDVIEKVGGGSARCMLAEIFEAD